MAVLEAASMEATPVQVQAAELQAADEHEHRSMSMRMSMRIAPVHEHAAIASAPARQPSCLACRGPLLFASSASRHLQLASEIGGFCGTGGIGTGHCWRSPLSLPPAPLSAAMCLPAAAVVCLPAAGVLALPTAVAPLVAFATAVPTAVPMALPLVCSQLCPQHAATPCCSSAVATSCSMLLPLHVACSM